MNKNIDLTELLKDCPSGMELDCTMYDNVTLKSVSLDINGDYPISIETKCGFNTKLTKYGQNICIDDAKCVIFPKGKTTWEGFQRPFVDGDVVFSGYNLISIYKKETDNGLCSYVSLSNDTSLFINLNNWTLENIRLATEEEKEKLFQAIKDNGYKWNSETKTLENLIVPKFKVEDKIHTWTLQDAKEGDVLAINWYEGCDYWEKIVIFKKYHNEGATSPCVEGYGNTFKNRKLAFHEEVPRFSKTWTACLEPATKEQRDLLFQKIKEAGYKWNADEKKLEKMIVPKFKVGDTIRSKNGLQIYNITNVTSEYYSTKVGEHAVVGILPVKDQDDWILIPNRLITEYKIYYTRDSTGEDHHLTFSTQEAMEGCLECMRETNKTCTTYLNIVCKKETVETLDL